MKSKGFWGLLSAGFIFSTFGVLIRGLDVMFTDVGQSWGRAMITAFVTGMAIIILREKLYVAKKDWGRLFTFSIISPLAVVCFTYSINQIKISNAVATLYAGNIAASFALGVLIFREDITRWKLLAIVVVFAGLASLAYPFDLGGSAFGLALSLISGVLEGIMNTLRKGLKDIDRMTVVFYQYLISVVVYILMALVTGDQIIKQVELLPVLLIIVFGVSSALLGNLLLYGFRNFDVGLGTIVLASELFFSMLLGLIFLAEVPTLNELIGGILIFAAVGVTAR